MKNSNISDFCLRFNIRGMVCFVVADEPRLQRMLEAYHGERKAIVFGESSDAVQRLIADNNRLVALEGELASIFAEESYPVRIRRLYTWLMAAHWHDCVEVCFCDHAMLEPSGANLLSVIPRSRIRRVIITDGADAQDVLNMINSGHIDAYLSIDDTNLAKQIRTYSDYGPILQVDGIWREVAPELNQLLASPELRAKLGHFLDALDVDEHILLSTPCGLLCRTKAGKGIWVQLEVKETQIGAVEILREQGLSTADLTPILQGEKAACLEVLPALHASDEAVATWADITVLNAEPWLGMAVFDLPRLNSGSV
jgi:hypothetical protein